MKNIDCLVIGDCFFDITTKLSAYSRSLNTGGVVNADEIRVLPGGTGNVAVAISRLGGSAAFCGVVGDDPLGRYYIRDLNENSIHALVHKKPSLHTGVLLALLSGNAQRSFVVSRGANDCLNLELVKDAFKKFKPNVLFVTGFSLTKKTMERIIINSIDLGLENNSKIVFDCTPFNLIPKKIDIFSYIIRKSHVICLNYQEACSLVGPPTTEKLINLLELKNSFFALKLGSKGCKLVSKRGATKIRARKVLARDTNGAGDCFAGAMVYGISRNLTPLEMGHLGVKLATLKVKYYGPRIPTDVLFT